MNTSQKWAKWSLIHRFSMDYKVIISLLFLSGCAQMVTPTGGLRDTTPPKVIKMEPLNNSVLFKTGEKIKLTFDEYADIINPNDKVMISPPLKNAPSFKFSGKNLIIEFEDTLKENATYSLFFDNCIRDITENNPIPSFEYNFSTGSAIDSGKIAGTVLNAITLKPEKQVYVMLYPRNEDSLPTTEKPYYITKTTDLGTYAFAHLAVGNYKLFALNDKNNNLIFDQLTESIGFSPVPIATDDAQTHDLKMFMQEDTLQRLLKSTMMDKGMFLLTFRKSALNTKFSLKNGVFEQRFFTEYSAAMDSVFLYDSEVLNDTSLIYITDTHFSDTLELISSTTQKSNRKRGQSQHIATSIKQENDYYKPLLLVFNRPIKNIDLPKIHLFKMDKDTIAIPFKIGKQDSICKHFTLDFAKEEQTKYNLIIEDSAFIGFNTQANDSLKSQFTVLSQNDYGNLKIHLQNSKNEPLIVQLLDNQQNVIGTEFLKMSGDIVWKNLLPGNYQLQAIVDANDNKIWDTGNYYFKLLPEKIVLFATPIIIRAKWDIEEKFVVN